MKCLVILVALVTCVFGFRDAQDGAKIVPESIKDSYSIPLRNALRQVGGFKGVAQAFDDAEFNLLSRMKTVEIPPSQDSTDFYAQMKNVHASRFNTRSKRSPQSGGLKFDGQSSSKDSNHPKSIQGQLPRQNLQQAGSINFEGSVKGPNSKGSNEEDNKRFFPEMYGIGYAPYGHHHGHGGHLGHGGNYGGHPYYPTGGFQGYPGGYYGNGGYPVGNVGYPVGGGYYPGGIGVGTGASSSASASSGGVGGYRPGYGGGFGNGLYGNGYYPGNGYYGAGYPTTYPIVGGGVPPPGIGIGGFFRDEEGKGGKVTAGASSSGGKVTGGVSFE